MSANGDRMTRHPVPVRHFYIDEAGDLALFDRRGRVLVGTVGVSHTFMVGVCELPNPMDAEQRLKELHRALCADPYFRGVPSFAPNARKTFVAFHAKDDLPEVRREVFRLLPDLQPKILVAIRRKVALVDFARELHRLSRQKLHPDLIYDDLVEKLCANLLHKADENRLVFARRGKADRNVALGAAIGRAKERFNQKWGTTHDRPVVINSGVPSQYAGLQVTDYLIWAVQRMIERREDRYFNSVAPCVRLVMDLDDVSRKGYGEWYSDANALTLEKLKPVTPG